MAGNRWLERPASPRGGGRWDGPVCGEGLGSPALSRRWKGTGPLPTGSALPSNLLLLPLCPTTSTAYKSRRAQRRRGCYRRTPSFHPPPPRPCPPLVPPTVGGASAGEAASRASLPNVRWWPGWQRSAPSSEIARLSLKGRRSSRPSARLGRRRPQVPPQERRCGFFALLPPTTTTATSSPPPLRPASPRFPRRLSPSLPTLLLLLPSASFPAHPPTRPPPGSVRESRAHAPRAGQGGGRRVSAS